MKNNSRSRRESNAAKALVRRQAAKSWLISVGDISER